MATMFFAIPEIFCSQKIIWDPGLIMNYKGQILIMDPRIRKDDKYDNTKERFRFVKSLFDFVICYVLCVMCYVLCVPCLHPMFLPYLLQSLFLGLFL